MKLNLSSGSSSPAAKYSTDSTDGKLVPRENALTSTKILAGGRLRIQKGLNSGTGYGDLKLIKSWLIT